MAKNPFTEAVRQVIDEASSFRKEAIKTTVEPFMTERVSKEQAARRFRAMAAAERQQYIQQIGISKAMELARYLKEHGNASRG